MDSTRLLLPLLPWEFDIFLVGSPLENWTVKSFLRPQYPHLVGGINLSTCPELITYKLLTNSLQVLDFSPSFCVINLVRFVRLLKIVNLKSKIV